MTHLSALLDGVARSSGPEEAVIHLGQRWNYREFADAATPPTARAVRR
ncbi:hypothetical protein [Streptomyces parvus]|nr:hypothetical protein [Streptomyces parvus]MCQ1578011.1 hypothetical protein [Streptomyces parvus]